jgi:hypothetical protein
MNRRNFQNTNNEVDVIEKKLYNSCNSKSFSNKNDD